jgi:hypothetical protein
MNSDWTTMTDDKDTRLGKLLDGKNLNLSWDAADSMKQVDDTDLHSVRMLLDGKNLYWEDVLSSVQLLPEDAELCTQVAVLVDELCMQVVVLVDGW